MLVSYCLGVILGFSLVVKKLPSGLFLLWDFPLGLLLIYLLHKLFDLFKGMTKEKAIVL